MPYDAFISYSHKDKLDADAACAIVEAAGIRCWIAPRDIHPGADWSESISEGIDQCRVLVLIFSSNSNESRQVRREVAHAFNEGLTIVPVRIEQIEPNRALKFHIESFHWLDALSEPREQYLRELAAHIKAILETQPGAVRERQEQERRREHEKEEARIVAKKEQQAEAAPGRWGRRRTAVAFSIAAAVILIFALLIFVRTGPNTPPPTTVNTSLAVKGNSAATPIGIPAPSDPDYPAVQLSITVAELPSIGRVVLADGTTAITVGESLTVEQLTGLMFVPARGTFDKSSAFSYRVANPKGLTAAGTAIVRIAPNTTPPTTVSASLTVKGNSAATPIGIPAPSDPDYPAVQLSITVAELPSIGRVVLADGTTAITVGESLTVEQLTGLMFVPARGTFDKSSAFSYRVANPNGLTAAGTATVRIAPNTTPPTTVSASLTVKGNSAATPIGIPAPSDPDYPAVELRITVAELPSIGRVVLADGTTAITVGESLTVEQLTGLMFVPARGTFDKSSAFSYRVANPKGLTAAGTATVKIAPNTLSPPQAPQNPATTQQGSHCETWGGRTYCE